MPVPHGNPYMGCETVMMTRIEDEDGIFVHASDIQLFDSEVVALILAWKPDIVLAAGPPLYLGKLTSHQQRQTWRNGIRLACEVGTLILDHHLLRSEAGLRWLERLASATGRQVLCAADFMGHPRRLLEARRVQLYKEMPVPKGWHEAYAVGQVDTSSFQVYTDAYEGL
jgi:predicted metallo-beta-lactamase superfamily hydrolase